MKGMWAAVAVAFQALTRGVNGLSSTYSPLLFGISRYYGRSEQFGEQAVILDGLFPGKIGLAEGPIVVGKRQARRCGISKFVRRYRHVGPFGVTA